MLEMSENLKLAMKAAVDDLMTAEVTAFSRSVSEEFGIPKFDVLLKALSLFKLAAEAEARGDRIAVLSPDDKIVTELTGVREALDYADYIMH